MLQVLEVIELMTVVLMIGLGMWLVDVIQRKTGHPLYDEVEDE